MYETIEDNEFLRILDDYYPRNISELYAAIYKILSMPCARNLEKEQLFLIFKIDESAQSHINALNSIDGLIAKIHRNNHQQKHIKSANLHFLIGAIDVLLFNFRHPETML